MDWQSESTILRQFIFSLSTGSQSLQMVKKFFSKNFTKNSLLDVSITIESQRH